MFAMIRRWMQRRSDRRMMRKILASPNFTLEAAYKSFGVDTMLGHPDGLRFGNPETLEEIRADTDGL